MTAYSKGKTTYDQTTVTAGVTGDLFKLPAGPVGLALGAEYRTFDINDVPVIFWESFTDFEEQLGKVIGRLARTRRR